MSRIPSKIGKYEIEDKIAEGGMGAVFKGTHPTLDRPVVLKKLMMSTNEHLIERFRREAKIMMEFSNENIVRVYDHFKNASAYYIVQELVDGKSVDVILKKERYLRYDEALYIFYYACKALDYAHKNQVVHRDIKPANILVSKGGEIKLVDFGIAQSDEEEESLTKEGMALGTPSYMAPEQYDDSRNVTFKADIYSLGIMLYEMVTGKKPYPGKMNPDTLMKIHKGKFVPPRKINPTLPSGINWYIRKCIQAKPQKRAASVSLLLSKLEKWFQSTDIERIKNDLIRIVNDQERVPHKPVRKTKVFKWYTLVVLLFLISAGGYYLYSTGFHYRTIFASQYGGFHLTQKIASPLNPIENYRIETIVFKDAGGRISDEKAKTLLYGVDKKLDDGSIMIQSPDVFLPPGSYWLKTSINEKVYWQNIFIPPFSNAFINLKPAPVMTFVLDWPVEKPKPLNLQMDVRSRYDGRDLNDDVLLTVEINKQFVPLDDLEQKLMTGKSYNFKVEVEGYYPQIYDLGIKIHQDQLILNPRMIPKEGFIRLKSSQDLSASVKILIDDKDVIIPGGLSSEMISTSELTGLKKIPLTPGTYTFEFQAGKIHKTKDVTIRSGEETVLTLELNTEKKKINNLLIKE
jgi:serine/threonine-protein kinase